MKCDLKVPFFIAPTPTCRGCATAFPGLHHFTLDPNHIMLSVKQGCIRYHFLSLWYDSTRERTQVSQTIDKHSFPIPMGQYLIYIYIFTQKYGLVYNKNIYILTQKVSKIKLATVIEGDPMSPFPIAATSRCRRGHYSFLWFAPLYS